MKQSDDSLFIPMTSVTSTRGEEVRPGVYYYTNQIVNVVMLGVPGKGSWVLVDAGMPRSGSEIIKVARKRFGNQPPAAILLTHGHFDHVGGIVDLVRKWEVAVYAHPLEFPYLTGEKAYPEPDSSVEGGLLSKLSSFFPHEPTDISEKLMALPANGAVPFLPGWRWIHVPGHAPGQVAFFREEDRLLISADAFITVRQDSLYKVLLQSREVNGPPRYFTTDWKAAGDSVARLQALDPAVVVPGHGRAMEGQELATGLRHLADNFLEVAVPAYGRYV